MYCELFIYLYILIYDYLYKNGFYKCVQDKYVISMTFFYIIDRIVKKMKHT